MLDADHNWLQGTTKAIVVDVGVAAKDDRAIVFNSTDHLGVAAGNCVNADQRLWNKVIEGIEFTVYGSNDLGDATAAAGLADVFGVTEAGTVPGSGTGSSFEQADLEFVFEDGWRDFGNADEGDDFASVWKFPSGTKYQYIAVYSNETDPFVGDDFRSLDNELDAIGVFIGDPAIPKVGINIHPTSFPSPVNVCTTGMGASTPVTIWGSATFPVAEIELVSLMLGSNALKTKGMTPNCSVADVGAPNSSDAAKVSCDDQTNPCDGADWVEFGGSGDTFDDLICHFFTAQLTGDVIEDAGTFSLPVTGVSCDDGMDVDGLYSCASGTPIAFEGIDEIKLNKKCLNALQ